VFAWRSVARPVTPTRAAVRRRSARVGVVIVAVAAVVASVLVPMAPASAAGKPKPHRCRRNRRLAHMTVQGSGRAFCAAGAAVQRLPTSGGVVAGRRGCKSRARYHRGRVQDSRAGRGARRDAAGNRRGTGIPAPASHTRARQAHLPGACGWITQPQPWPAWTGCSSRCNRTPPGPVRPCRWAWTTPASPLAGGADFASRLIWCSCRRVR